MTKLKTARHHWWPKGVSRHWEDSNGLTYRLTPDGSRSESRAKNFGSITNAHQIRFSPVSEWNEDFEDIYSDIDNKSPDLINWIKNLDRKPKKRLQLSRSRFQSLPITDDRFRDVVELLVSFVTRSPRIRELVISQIEPMIGEISKRESKNIISGNLRHCQDVIMKRLESKGKLLILFTPSDEEFIFGDGFFSNFFLPCDRFTRTPTKILLPLLPQVSVLYVLRDLSYDSESRLMTITASNNEILELNNIVQIYSKREIFYRSLMPDITQEFQQNLHLEFGDSDHIVEWLIRKMLDV